MTFFGSKYDLQERNDGLFGQTVLLSATAVMVILVSLESLHFVGCIGEKKVPAAVTQITEQQEQDLLAFFDADRPITDILPLVEATHNAALIKAVNEIVKDGTHYTLEDNQRLQDAIKTYTKKEN
jgi:hypothetical protein